MLGICDDSALLPQAVLAFKEKCAEKHFISAKKGRWSFAVYVLTLLCQFKHLGQILPAYS